MMISLCFSLRWRACGSQPGCLRLHSPFHRSKSCQMEYSSGGPISCKSWRPKARSPLLPDRSGQKPRTTPCKTKKRGSRRRKEAIYDASSARRINHLLVLLRCLDHASAVRTLVNFFGNCNPGRWRSATPRVAKTSLSGDLQTLGLLRTFYIYVAPNSQAAGQLWTFPFILSYKNVCSLSRMGFPASLHARKHCSRKRCRYLFAGTVEQLYSLSAPI